MAGNERFLQAQRDITQDLRQSPEVVLRILSAALNNLSAGIERVLRKDADGFIITITPYQGSRHHPIEQPTDGFTMMTGKEVPTAIKALIDDAVGDVVDNP